MATIEECYVSFETAKLLKEKGFPQQRMEFAVATRDCSLIVNGSQKVKERVGTRFPYYPYSKLFLYEEDWAVLPTLQMAMKWLREVHNLVIQVELIDFLEHGEVWLYSVIERKTIEQLTGRNGDFTEHSYEEACEAAIKYSIEHLI